MERISVSELFKCPDFSPVRWFRPYIEYGKYVHDAIEDELKRRYPEGESEYRVRAIIELDDGIKVEIYGYIDYVRFDEPIFYEIKPFTRKIPVTYMAQMWTYELILRMQTNRWYVGNFVFYDRRTGKWWTYTPLLHFDNDWEWLKEVVKWRIRNRGERLRSGLCKFCELRDTCRARYTISYRGVEEV